MHSRGTIATSICVLAGLLTACGGSASTPTPSSTTPVPSASAPAASSTPAATPATVASASARPVLPPPASATQLAAGDARQASMVRVQAETCDQMLWGTATFVASDLVVTADAVTDKASAIAVHSATGVVRGQVVARDTTSGLSVVKLLPTGDGGRLTGTPLSVGTAPATTVLGFPTGHRLHADAQADPSPGVPGDARLGAGGQLVGVDVAGPAGDSRTADGAAVKAVVAQATSKPAPSPFVKCPIEGASMTSIHPDGPAVRGALARYVLGLWEPEKVDPATGLTGLQTAWNSLSPTLQKKYGTPKGLQDSFAQGRTSNANVDNLEYTDFFTDTLIWAVHVEGPGTKCVVHKQKLVLTTVTGPWTIDSATDLVPPYPCEA